MSTSSHDILYLIGEFRYAGCSYIDRVAQQDQSYFEVRDNLRNARRKKDGKPEIKATTIRKSTLAGANKSSNSNYIIVS